MNASSTRAHRHALVRGALLLSTLFAALSLGALGCERSRSQAVSGSHARPTGSVELSLRGEVGGVVYRLRQGVFQLSGLENRALRTEEDPDREALTATLLAGPYQIRLESGWELERLQNGSWEVVPARLVSENPRDFSIQAGSLTRLVYVFDVGGVVVELERGDVEVVISVTDAGTDRVTTTPVSPLRQVSAIELRLNSLFYAPGSGVTLTLAFGGLDPGTDSVQVVLSAPKSRDVEAVTLTRAADGLFTAVDAVIIGESTSTSGIDDGTLSVPPGEAFYAMYAPNRSQLGLASYPADLVSDFGFREDPNAMLAAIDANVALSDDESAAALRPSGTLLRHGTLPVQVATREVIFWSSSERTLAEFLALSGGEVTERQVLEPASTGASYEAMLRIAVPAGTSVDRPRLAALDAFLGETEALTASNEGALSIVSRVLQWRLDGWAVAVNPRLQLQGAPQLAAGETLFGATPLGHTMTLQTPTLARCMPGDETRPCVENVPAAWAFAELWDYTDQRIQTAVLDMGFSTNAEYRPPESGPMIECNMTTGDPLCVPGAAQGSPTVGNSLFGGRSWHGSGVVQTLGGVVNNGQPFAGVAGQVAVPALYKFDLGTYAFEIGAGIRRATEDGASVINLSAGYPCNIITNFGPEFDICSEPGRLGICALVHAGLAAAHALACIHAFLDFGATCGATGVALAGATSACLSTLAYGNLRSPMQAGVRFAADRGVPVVTIAGNALTRESLPEVVRDLANTSDHRVERWGIIPAMIPETIVVGAVDANMVNQHFFGARVDLWAPIESTYVAPQNPANPASAPSAQSIGGTSGAAPYVAGVIALMQAADEDLDPQQTRRRPEDRRVIINDIKRVLRETSFTEADLVALGLPSDTRRTRVVNPLGALMAVSSERIRSMASLGYEMSLGFSELEVPNDTQAQALPLAFGLERAGTTVVLRPNTADQDWYSIALPAGTRPYVFDVRLTFPRGDAVDVSSPNGVFGDEVTVVGSEAIRTRQVIGNAGSAVLLSVAPSSPAGDGLYKVRVENPRPAVPTARIVAPRDLDEASVCANRPITLRAEVGFASAPSVGVPQNEIRWTTGGIELGRGSSINAELSVGVYDIAVRAYGARASQDVIRLTVSPCGGLPPSSVQILSPASDSTNDREGLVYDGFDPAVGLWYVDVAVAGSATDPEDGALSGESLIWRTDRADVHPGGASQVGTGAATVIRLYSDDCFGTQHVLHLEATDSDGNTVVDERRIYIWTLC